MQTTPVQDIRIREWVGFAREEKISVFMVRGRKNAERFKVHELRKGKISDGALRGLEVLAFGHDELGNLCALLPNGGVRQYLATDRLEKS